MSHIEHFEDLEVWQLSKNIANQIYDITSVGKFSQDYVLRDQIRRAVVSIFSNIAEGFERNGNKEFLQFLSIAKASCGEVRAQLIFAEERDYISNEQFEYTVKQLLNLSKQIAGLSRYLKQSEMRGSKFKI